MGAPPIVGIPPIASAPMPPPPIGDPPPIADVPPMKSPPASTLVGGSGGGASVGSGGGPSLESVGTLPVKLRIRFSASMPDNFVMTGAGGDNASRAANRSRLEVMTDDFAAVGSSVVDSIPPNPPLARRPSPVKPFIDNKPLLSPSIAARFIRLTSVVVAGTDTAMRLNKSAVSLTGSVATVAPPSRPPPSKSPPSKSPLVAAAGAGGAGAKISIVGGAGAAPPNPNKSTCGSGAAGADAVKSNKSMGPAGGGGGFGAATGLGGFGL
mmetsp:Transcript_18888/g.31232  ORF Transcript_18888/g.31232 Transcript_18888/m.31232 type:complete len:267 (-) Transcript_18888:864-1664(-)